MEKRYVRNHPKALQPQRRQQHQNQLHRSVPSLTERCSVSTSAHKHSTSVWVSLTAAFTDASASGGRDLVAGGTRADEASLGVGAGSKRADLGQLGALVNIWNTGRKDINHFIDHQPESPPS